MRKTIFAGLTILEAGESLSTDSGAFTGRDREIIDRLLHVGAKTHRHTEDAGLVNPPSGLGASIIASAGTIGADLDISVGYTLEDVSGGETMLSPVVTVSTGPPLPGPQAAASAAADYTAGGLLVNTYFYAATFTDGEGGETPLGPSVSVERQPGFASGRVLVSNLTFGLEEAGAGGWRLYRATGGGTYGLIATGGPGDDTFIDDGTNSVDCDINPPPGESNTTVGINTLLVQLPGSGATASASFINVYATITGDFGGGSLLGSYPVASAGFNVVYSTLELGELTPPDTNLSIGGAHKIDPDQELLDWHWRRPVETQAELPLDDDLGDVRIARDTGVPYYFTASGWVELQHHVMSHLVEEAIGYQLGLEDDGAAIDILGLEDCFVEVPADAIVPFQDGTVIEVARLGEGQVFIQASGGVTVDSIAGASAISDQFGVGFLRKRGPDAWLLYGDLA